MVSYIPTLESIQEVNIVTNSMDAEQGLAGGAAINVQTRSGTNSIHGSGFEYFTNQHLKAWPMRFDDAALNTGDKPEASYNQFGGTVGRADQKEQAVLFRQLRRDAGPPGRRPDRDGALPAMLRGDLQMSPTPIYDPLSGNPDGTGRTQFQVFPGDPNYALCNHATNPSCLNIIPAARHGSDRAGHREPLSGQQHRPGTETTISSPRPSRTTAIRWTRRSTTTSTQVQPGGHIRRPALQDVGADGLR